MGFFDRFRKKKEPEMPYASREAGEEIRPAQRPAPEDEDPFSERVIAELEAQGLTINWRYGYRLANRYEVKRIRAGGQGVVFIAEDLIEKGKRYAAKTLKAYFRKPKAEDEWEGWRDSANSYLRECNIWVDLEKHRHIVHAEYLDKIEGVPLVMSEFIDGGGLNDWLKKGRLDMTTALDYAIQACIGMEYANKKGVVVHRDIKPGNILVTRDGVAKINDFGIAKAIESAGAIRPRAEAEAALDSASLFISGVSRRMGTPEYMAPEQFPEPLLSLVGYPLIPLGVEADIYAFGLVLYEMLTGKLVVQIESDREMEIQRAVHHIISIPGVNPGYVLKNWARIVYCLLKTLKTIPPKPSRNERLNAVILKCLKKDPAQRYRSFTELREELMRIYQEETGREYQLVEEPPYQPNWRNRAKTSWILGREKEAFSCYDKALEENPADILTWLEKGLASAENGDLEEFGLCMEITSYLKPSRESEVEQCKKQILDEPNIKLRDIRLLDRLTSGCAVSERARDCILNKVREEIADPFREPNPVLSQLSEQLNSADASVRMGAVLTMAVLGDRSAVPALIEALKDEDPKVRREAALALRKLGDKWAVPALNEALEDRDFWVRWVAAFALEKLDNRSRAPELIKALKHEDPKVRREAAEALGELGDGSVVPALKEAMGDADDWVVLMAAISLCMLGDRLALQEVIPWLIRALKMNINEDLRKCAAKALGRLGDKSAVPALKESLKDENYEVRREAAVALGKLGDKSALPALIKAALKGKFVATDVLRKLDDGSAVPALIEALKDENHEVQVAALKILGGLGDKSAVPTLTEALKDENYEVRREAAYTLGRLGDKSAAPALIDALMNGFMFEVALEALVELGDRSAVPALIKLLKHSRNKVVRWKVATALGKLGDKSAVPTLTEALKDENYQVRLDAAVALVKLDDSSAVPILIEALKDEDRLVRDYAARALGELGDKSAVPTLIEALASFSKSDDIILALRKICSQLDKVKLSQTKDKLRACSAFEWYKRGSELTAQSEYDKALECFEKAVGIDPDWEETKKARDECLKKCR